jgi:hypothetical protein
MCSKDLIPGDWINIPWIAYKLYVVENTDRFLYVASPSWRVNDKMKFRHWEFEKTYSFVFLGKSKPNPLYNPITKLGGFIHPVTIS